MTAPQKPTQKTKPEQLFGGLGYNWVVLIDEQMSNRWPFSLLNGEQMSNWVVVKHLPDNYLPMGLKFAV